MMQCKSVCPHAGRVGYHCEQTEPHNLHAALLDTDTPMTWTDAQAVRKFNGGATRDSEQGKYDLEGFLSPRVLMEYARYMDKHRHMADGTVRGSDNWQSGMPRDVYMKSLLRHVFDLWLLHREGEARRPETGELVDVHDALGGIVFNAFGFWLEHLKAEQ